MLFTQFYFHLDTINSIDLYELSDDKDNYYLKSESKLRIIDKEDATWIEKVNEIIVLEC